MNPLVTSGTECYFTSVPMELHLRIRNELLKDPDVTYNYLKCLRLVCKLFDLLWSPVVLVNLSLFPNNLIHGFNPEYLGQLVDGKNLHTFNTVTVKNWHYLNSGLHYFFKRLMKLWVADRKTALIQIPPALVLAIPVNLVIFLGAPTKITRRLQMFSTVLRARRYARTFPHKLQLPNVSCVRWNMHPHDSRWEVYWTTRFLTMVPNLTELVLRLSTDADMAYISRHLKNLHTLRKFTLQTYHPIPIMPRGPSSRLSFFSAVIARNPNLTHLALMLSPCDFSEMLRDIPDNKPLRLEHITINCYCRKTDALLPHIQSLSSIETRLKHVEYDTIYNMLGRTLVFPTTILADSLGEELCMYLLRHPGVINLSIGHKSWPGSFREDYGLSKVVMRHSGTLQKLSARSYLLLTLDAEVALLKCVHLRELVLIRFHSRYHRVQGTIGVDESDRHVLNIAARLSRSLTVVIEQLPAFWACVKYCRDSENPLLHDLAGRIVYYETLDKMFMPYTD